MKLNEVRDLLQSYHQPVTSQDQERVYAMMRAAGIEPGEVYQELEMDSRYVNTHSDASFSNSTIHLHSHSFYELICCRNTCGVEYMVGSRRYRIRKGDILFISPDVSHRPILPEKMPEAYIRDVLWVSKDFARILEGGMSDHFRWENSGSLLIRTAGTKWEFLTDMFRKGVLEAERKDLDWQLAVMGNTMALIANLRRAAQYQSAHASQPEAPDLLDQVMAYVESHLSEKITLGDTARHFFVSESTISHLFRQKMGVSFYRCITQRRLIAAKELIWQDVPLETVAEQVGFTDYSAFFRAFKQEFGISPSQYRKLKTD